MDLTIWYVIFTIIGILIFLIIIFGFPRKKMERIPSMEAIDEKSVIKAFEHMTNFLPFKMLRRKVIKNLKKMKPKGTLVDIGCGSGKLIIQIAEHFDNLTLIGVDIAEDMIALAKENSLKKGQRDKIEYKIGTAEELSFSDDSIDFIISTLSLHHWSNPLIIFQEIYRVLKENGKFLIFDFRRDSRKFFYGLFRFATKVVIPKALKKVKEPLGSISASYTTLEANQLLKQISFQKVDIMPYLAWFFISGRK